MEAAESFSALAPWRLTQRHQCKSISLPMSGRGSTARVRPPVGAKRLRARRACEEESAHRRAAGRQVIRQWRLLVALQHARRGLTVPELMEIAEECTIRTLYRDLDQLSAAGFTLTQSEGRWLVECTHPPPLALTPVELTLLQACRQLLAPLEGTALMRPLAELEHKLAAHLTPEGRRFAQELGRTLSATVTAPSPMGGHESVADVIHHALEREHKLEIEHRSPKRDAVTRTVDPYCFWYDAGATYLVGFCHRAGAVRKFHLRRVLAARELDAPFERDPSFDMDAYVRSAFGAHHGGVVRIVFKATAQVAHLFEETLWHPTQTVSTCEGGVRVTMDCGGLEQVARWLAGFGSDVCPVEPEQLSVHLRRIHEGGIAALSGGGDRS